MVLLAKFAKWTVSDYPEWRFNVRISNTEPVVRLNVETRGDKKLLEEKTAEVLAVIRG